MTDDERSSSSYQTFPIVAVLLVCFLAQGCVKTAKSYMEVSRLQAAIVKQYREPEVHVNLQDTNALTVIFINSPLNKRDLEARRKRAEVTAVFVRNHSAGFEEIGEIWIGFVQQEADFIVVTQTQDFGFFGFDKDAKPLIGPGNVEGYDYQGIRPSAVYSPSLKQTDVFITRLQLEGDLDEGIALAPHFKVAGDASNIRRSDSYPQSVSFDFASYSKESLFPGITKVSAVTDGRVVFETKGEFSTSKLPGGNFSEFLLLPVPYPAFRKMVSGKNLILRLGTREYELAADELAALQEMTEFVKE